MTVRVDQAGASLLGAKEAPPPPPTNGASAGGAGGTEAPAAPPPAFDEQWVRKCIVLLCNGLAEEWGPEMRATELELGILVPVLHAMASQHAPEFMAGRAPEANLWVLGGIVLYMGARRGMAIRRRRRLGDSAAAPKTPKPTPAAGPATVTHATSAAGAPAGAPAPPSPSPSRPAAGGAFGRSPLVLGGRLGDGRRL